MGKLQIHRPKASVTTPFQPVSRPFAPASPVRRTIQAPAASSEVAPQDATRSRWGNCATQPTHVIRPLAATQRTPVVQRAKIKLTFKELGSLKIENDSFAAYLEKGGFTFDHKNKVLDTGKVDGVSFSSFLEGYEKFKEEYKELKQEAVVQPEEFRKFGEERVKDKFQGAEITQLVQIGKNNFGIYRIVGMEETPWIVKVLGPGHSMKSLTDTKKTTETLSERYSKSQKQGKFEINTLYDFQEFSDGRVTVKLAIFKEQGVMSLDDALLNQDLDVGVLVGAARGLADRTARFHFAPIAEKDTEGGSYLFHGDLNTSNIMLDYDGIMGLIDNDDLKQVDDPRKLIWDISSLLATMRVGLEKRYPPNGVNGDRNVYEEMAMAFKSQYIATMHDLNVPDSKTIADEIGKM